MSRVRALIAGVLLCLFACAGVHAESPDTLPKPTSYVSDFAGVIDAQSKQNIEDLATQVYDKAHATIVVVTIHSLDGLSIEEFATSLEDRWKVGPKDTDKGVLLIFAINDHKRRIEVGYGLEGILNDAKVGDIGRSMVPQLQAGAYGPAIQSGVQQIANVIAADANVTLTAPQQSPDEYQPREYSAPRRHTNWFGIVFFIIFLLLIFRGGGGGGGGRGWFWFLLGNILGGGMGGGGYGGRGGGDFGGGGGGGDFGGGFGGGSGGGGASGGW